MSNKKTKIDSINQYALNVNGRKKVKLWALVFLIFAPLCFTVVFFPAEQILFINVVSSDVPYYIFYYIARIIQVCTLFGFFSLLAIVTRRKESKIRSLLWWGQVINQLVIFCVLETALYFLTAFIDSKDILGISLCNKPLDALTENGCFELFMTGVNLLITALITLALSVIVIIAMNVVRRAKGPKHYYIPYILSAVISYLAVQIISSAIGTVITLSDSGAPQGIGDVLYLIKPYIETGIYTLIGYFFMIFFIPIIEGKKVK